LDRSPDEPRLLIYGNTEGWIEEIQNRDDVMNNFMNARYNWQTQKIHYHPISLLLLLMTGCIPSNPAVTQPTTSAVATNSTSEILAPGIKMWTPASKRTHVIEADLTKTTLRSISGEPTPTGKVGQMKFEEFWAKNHRNGMLQVLVNGTFFQTYNKPTGIAFGLKQDSKLITYGYGLNEFPDRTVTVAWSDGRMAIEPYSRSTFDGPIPNVVGALAPTAGKNADKLLPRTFVGVKNRRADKTYSTVLFFVSPGASQSQAEQILRNLGAERVAMLDGGQSTGLIVDGKTLMQPKTRIPQAIGIFTK
jgi:Phosphodiester glycosidase